MVNIRLRSPREVARRGMGLFDWPSFFSHDDFISPFEAFFRDADTMMENMWAPRVDIIEKPDAWVFKAELPDIKPEDINVKVQDNVLTIKGERKFEEEVKEEAFTRIERHYGAFERRFSLPKNVADDQISADYKNGVLTLSVPKKEEAKPKSVEIKVQ